MVLDYQKIKQRRFAREVRPYQRAELVRFAQGFGAGLPGPLQQQDQRYLGDAAQALPMAAVALADGEFWQADPAAGLNWRQIVHAEEAIEVHRPLPPDGTVLVDHRVDEIYDRGPERGAMMVEELALGSPAGERLVTIRVITVLKADGGFGGSAEGAPKPVPVPADRPPDLSIELLTPRAADQPAFLLSTELAIASAAPGKVPGQRMMRGLAAFGVAGRGVLGLACGNDPGRLRRLSVRYAGPLFTDETVRLELWRLEPGRVAFQMRAIERDAPVLQHCHADVLDGPA